jgi:O-antigen/teichoic acid export membrane protein
MIKKLFLNSISLYVGRFGTQLLSLLLIPLISTNITNVELTYYLLSLSIIGFSTVIFDYSSQTAAVKSVAQSVFSLRNVFGEVATIKVLASVIYFIFIPIILVSPIDNSFILVVLTCIAQGTRLTWFYNAISKRYFIVFTDLISKLSTYIILLTLSEISFFQVILVIFICDLIGTLFLNKCFFKLQWINPLKDSLKYWKKYLKSGKNQFLTRFYGAIYTNLTIPIAFLFFNTTVLANIAMAERLIRIVVSLLSPFTLVLYPILCSISDNSVKSKSYLAIIFIGFISSLSLLFYGAEINYYLFKESNSELKVLIAQLSFLPFLVSIGSSLGMLELNIKGRYQTLYKLSIVSLSSFVICMLAAIIFKDIQTFVWAIILPEICFVVGVLVISNWRRKC